MAVMRDAAREPDMPVHHAGKRHLGDDGAVYRRACT